MNPYAVMLQTDPDDKFITETTLAEMHIQVPVVFIDSVVGISGIITSQGEPTVILVNDSFSHTASEQLKLLKSNPEYNHIPVVVLGEVVSDEYVKKYYRAGANTYITKPSRLADTRRKIETFFSYWFEVATA